MFLASIFGLQDVTPQTWLSTSDCSATASSLLRGDTAGRQLYMTHGRAGSQSVAGGPLWLPLLWQSSARRGATTATPRPLLSIPG